MLSFENGTETDMGKFTTGNTSAKGHGRPAGSGLQTRLRAAITDAQFDQLVRRILTDALAGDGPSTALLMSRLCPQPKGVLEPIKFDLPGESLSDKANGILQAIAEGAIPPDVGQGLIGAIAAVARVVEIDDLERRLTILESR